MIPKNKNRFNLHTHSEFCDGKNPTVDYVEKALQLGFHTLGFSSHAPVPFINHFSLSFEKLTEYKNNISGLKEKYKDHIHIFTGLEIDYIPGMTIPFSDFRTIAGLDYTIGGVHLVREINGNNLWFIDGPRQEKYDEGLREFFDNNARVAVTAYYNQLVEMISNQKPDIVAHLDKIKMHNKDRYFNEQEDWYEKLVDEALDIIRSANSIVEVNTRGIYKKRCDSLYPGVSILKKIRKMNIPVTVSTDAHLPEELDAYLDETRDLLRDLGFREVRCTGDNGWYDEPI